MFFRWEYAGESVGLHLRQTIFDRAQELVKEKIINEDFKQPLDSLPRFEITSVSDSQVDTNRS
jgi:hypothetical protein